jgi:hypothetical protein
MEPSEKATTETALLAREIDFNSRTVKIREQKAARRPARGHEKGSSMFFGTTPFGPFQEPTRKRHNYSTTLKPAALETNYTLTFENCPSHRDGING